jgi:membrane protease YdiL (CAAX protease family)
MSAVARWIRSRSLIFEFLFVFIVAWVPNILAAVAWFAFQPDPVAVDQDAIWSGMFFEAIILAIVLPVLRLRGWTWARLGLSWQRRDLLVGLGIGVALTVAFQLVDLAAGGEREPVAIAPHLDPFLVVAFSLLNAFFEEVLLLGYIVGLAGERGRMVDGIWSNVAIRFLCHVYQGIWVAFEVAGMGVAFGYIYARTRRLWPLIIAHAAYDAAVLLAFLN